MKLTTHGRLLLLLFFCTVLSFKGIYAQDRFDTIKTQLTEIANENPGLNQRVELNVADISMAEFLNALAISNKLNISVDETLNFTITNNFSNVSVIDVLIFLARKYDLDVKLIGTIISVSKQKAPQVIAPLPKAKTFDVDYNKLTDQLSVDLKKDTLYAVAKQISRLSGKNLIIPQDLENVLVSGFVQNQSLSSALEMIAYANGLKVSSTQEGVFLFEKKEEKVKINPATKVSTP